MALLSEQQELKLTEFVSNGLNIKYVRGFINSRLNEIYRHTNIKSDILSPRYEFDVSVKYLENNNK